PAAIAASLLDFPAKTASANSLFLPVKAINKILQGRFFLRVGGRAVSRDVQRQTFDTPRRKCE
ncbi:hypothetical protein, partial [Burkholderia vietnamiensis]|uniref:hypothetical protein n=1 Tax=Burkholderia vietnamiensis TaxID=60552 RepID=UPI001BA1058B